ncbi:MAG: polyprenyl synthetase family protein [Candidatus Bathyarchaeia archaeon]|jgi:geranylgeranyl diphosphate synthase type I
MITDKQQIQTLLTNYGTPGLEIAKKTLNNPQIPPQLRNLASYFIEETWPNTHHPALMALTCEAVNGNIKKTYPISAAVVLLTGAADIHDDIIDKSKRKGNKQTAYGKFNKDLVLLAGDMLLFQGLISFHNAAENLPKKMRQAIFDVLEQSFFKIGYSITSERCLRKKPANILEYRNIIENKGCIAQACAEIGAIIGQGKPKDVEVLSHYGKTLGFLMTLKNEFTDMQDIREMKGRLKNEILPLPMLYAFKDAAAKAQITALLQDKLTKQNVLKINKIATATEEVQQLKQEMINLQLTEENALDTLKIRQDSLKLLLKSSTQGF